jgi:hypothetical protein
MPRVFSGACLTPETAAPIRLYMENGVELLIQPRQSDLKIHAIYHHHTLLSPNTFNRSVLLHQVIDWTHILDRNVSAHARMSWISGLPDYDEGTGGPCAHVDMSECDKIQVDYGLTQIFIVRKQGLGLSVLCNPGDANAPIETPYIAISQNSSEEISNTIHALAKETDRRLDDLPVWKRTALMVATDYTLALHLLEDGICHLGGAIKTQIQKRIA